jgi:hypothetical protein
MATFKCTIQMNLTTNLQGTAQGSRVGGWSESVYAQETEFATVKANFETLCLYRAGLLSSGAAVVGQRYQLIDPTGRSTTTGRRFPGLGDISDVPQMAVAFKLASKTTPNARRFVLAGIPDQVAYEGEYKPYPNFSSNLALFVWGLRNFRFRASNLSTSRVPLSSVSSQGVFVLQQPLVYDVNDYLTVSRAEAGSGETISGRFHVKAKVDAQNGTFSLWPTTATVRGTVKPDEVFYPLLDERTVYSPQITVRKIGRPSGGYRGRASRHATFQE